MSYVIIADSGCDVAHDLLEAWHVATASMHFRFEGEPGEYDNTTMPAADFYRRMREGASPKTSAVNADAFEAVFEPALQAGQDILYIGFSGGLSTTFNCARIAAEELLMKYRGHRILLVDSLSGSLGTGLLVHMAVLEKEAGANLDEAYQRISERAKKLNSWFTVDDLSYLRRGGRISAAAAIAGSTLNIKPIIRTDDTGHLVSAAKAIGRKAALKMLVQKFMSLAEDAGKCLYCIAHSDCREDALSVEEQIVKLTGNHAVLVGDIGAVVGSHCGPGTVALFFVGREALKP